MQYGYKDWVPSQSYYAFATKAGCAPSTAYGSSPQTVFSCLIGKDSHTLQNASPIDLGFGARTARGDSFLSRTETSSNKCPVSNCCREKGQRTEIVGRATNANEGPAFTPQNITTEDDLLAWLRLTFPLFSNDDMAKITPLLPQHQRFGRYQ
jgi:hypothetical protein